MDRCESPFRATDQLSVIELWRGAMRVGRQNRTAHSMDEGNERPLRKMSAEAVSRKSSFANSKFLSKSRQQAADHRLNGSDDADSRSNDSSLRDISHLDEPSCSEQPLPPDDGGTRRARSVTSSRISLFFGKERNEMINRLNALKEEHDRRESGMWELEKDWRQIVREPQELTRKATEQQEAIWELVVTEYRYIRLLRYMDDLAFYLGEVQHLGFLRDVDPNSTFRNYSELLNVNMESFWKAAIEPMLRSSRASGAPLDVRMLSDGFMHIIDWSKSYINFNMNYSECHAYMQKKTKENELFRDFVNWAESQENLDRQKLLDTLPKPMQRLTRYNLLLKAVLKVTTDMQEKELLMLMIDNAEKATKKLNAELNNNDSLQQMKDVMRLFEGYECVDGEECERLFGTRCVLNLCDPMPLMPPETARYRALVYRGDLRMKESRTGSKTDVHCFLFTDMFLLCRRSQGKKDRYKIIRPPIHINRLIYHPLTEASIGFYVVSINEFNIPSALCMMHTSSYEETKRWLEMIQKAREELNELYAKVWSGQTDVTASNGIDYARGAMFNGNGYHREWSFPGAQPPPSVVHRKSSSMDSQSMAAHAHLAYMRCGSTVSSTEQLDRHPERLDGSTRSLTRQKLSVASANANALSTSKSSVDLHLSLGAEMERPRSRSNSSGPDIEGITTRSRSPSPPPSIRKTDSGEGTPTHATEENAMPCRDSPTLLVTSDDCDQPPASGRRFEKRYHTADGIDVLKPKGSVLSGGILKRFSWNVSSAVAGSSRKISARLEHSRRHSQASTAASSESFGSSTSGISTASSTADTTADGTTITLKTSHISTVAVNETTSEPQTTLTIGMDLPTAEMTNGTTPPPPEIPPPSLTPSPGSEKSNLKQQELLKFIMDNHLETSDV
ncbi:unnamed protein product [Caenorhabditis auriculariae]|uniref:DH domain-containing protein n=1 Tax=Caenorhabditis auriculariae TaxID=2777116 RepID=A0A8S1HTC5_9PELO|nr:unnamed protein product [Caenorhabditis auriculariae]